MHTHKKNRYTYVKYDKYFHFYEKIVPTLQCFAKFKWKKNQNLLSFWATFHEFNDYCVLKLYLFYPFFLQECGKYPWQLLRTFVEVLVPWPMVAIMTRMQPQFKRSLPKTFWNITQSLRPHFHYFFTPLGSSTESIDKRDFSSSLIPFWLFRTFILLPVKN